MATLTLTITDDAALAIERYTDHALRLERLGVVTLKEWEEARSYAVEALTAVLRDNPDAFRYAAAMGEISEQRKSGGANR